MISRVQWFAVCGLVLLAGDFSQSAAEEPLATVPEKTILKFQELDRDSSGQLSVNEYVARREPTALYQRDFIIFDLDHDNSMSLAEFAPIAGGVLGNVRGPIPDPLVKLVDRIAADLDRRLKNWNERVGDEISLAEFSAVLPEEFRIVLTPNLLQQADTNRNGIISRPEAQRFLEIQLGLRLPNGRPLRMPNGRVNNYSFFLYLDRNSNQQLELAEFTGMIGDNEDLKKKYAESDKHGNGILTQDEWLISAWTYCLHRKGVSEMWHHDSAYFRHSRQRHRQSGFNIERRGTYVALGRVLGF